MSIQARVAKRYSKAFVDAVREKGSIDEELAYLKAFCSMKNDSAELNRYLQNVTIGSRHKVETLKALCQATHASEIMERFLVLLAQKGRLDCLDEIELAVIERVNQIQNIRDVKLTTGVDLSEKGRERLEKALSSKLQAKVRLKQHTDPGIWGGAVVQIGSTVYDGSLVGKLKRLRQELVKEN